MAEYIINADGEGSFYEYVGNTGEDDTVTVNITTGFRGSIMVVSSATDGEIDNVTLNIPDGWRLEVTESAPQEGTETPGYTSYSYILFNQNNDQVGTLSIGANEGNLACFTRGTMIQSNRGPVAIEDLAQGDLVITRDNGFKPVSWIGSTIVSGDMLARKPKLQPIRICAGALGHGLPSRDLIVSRQHRILIRSEIALRMFDTREVLVPAIKLVGQPGISVMDACDPVEYFHILLDCHEIVLSNGGWTETLFTGPEALKSIPPEARLEIETLFPQICAPDFVPVAARLIPQKGRMVKDLMAAHAATGTSLFADAASVAA